MPETRARTSTSREPSTRPVNSYGTGTVLGAIVTAVTWAGGGAPPGPAPGGPPFPLPPPQAPSARREAVARTVARARGAQKARTAPCGSRVSAPGAMNRRGRFIAGSWIIRSIKWLCLLLNTCATRRAGGSFPGSRARTNRPIAPRIVAVSPRSRSPGRRPGVLHPPARRRSRIETSREAVARSGRERHSSMPADDPTSPLWPRGRGPTGPPGGIALGPGQLLGRYYVLQEIGRGGMGVVYAAFDPELDRKVALKILHSGVGRDDGEGQARLLREAKALARLSHPNVIQVYDAGAVGGGELQVFVAMELAEGMTLDRWLLAPRSRSEVLAAFSAAGRGLAAAHAAGLVHRDFKPSNVLLGDDGRVRVLDFGIARPAGDTAFEPAGDPPQGLASGSPLPAITASAAALRSARGATGG